MKISDLIKPDEYLYSNAEPDLSVLYVTTDKDDIKNNSVFIIENESKIPDFETLYPSVSVIVASKNAILPDNIKQIRVENPRKMSALIHSRFLGIDYKRLKFIGITGTNGKTSTATMIYNILKDDGIKAGFIGTGRLEVAGKKINDTTYSMTTPPPSRLYKTIHKMQELGATHIVMEVSSHALAQERVSAIPFEYAVFTNLSSEHLDFHGDIEEYYKTKKTLFIRAKKMILNLDDPYGRRLLKEVDTPSSTIGVIFEADASAKEPIDRGFDGISYYYTSSTLSFRADLFISGIYNIYNSMLAAALCIDLGIAPYKVKESLGKIRSIPGRFEIIKSEITVIIDYAHTSEAFYQILKSISSNKSGSRLTVVFGCGGERDKIKRPKMAKTAEKFADKIIVTSDNPRNEDPKAIIEDIISGFSENRYEVYIDRKAAIEKAISESSPGDIVAIIGKGCEEYNIDKYGYHPFSEKDTVAEALKSR